MYHTETTLTTTYSKHVKVYPHQASVSAAAAAVNASLWLHSHDASQLPPPPHSQASPLIKTSGGFRISPRRGRQLPGGGVPTYNFAKISQKLHEIERMYVPRGACIPRAPLRSTTEMYSI